MFYFFFFTQGQPLVHNTSAKVIRSHQSLVLQKVNRQSAGIYQCSAFNSEGETRSNEFVLRVKCKLRNNLFYTKYS